jgi:V/A-type H+-transporting ATPase subunit C
MIAEYGYLNARVRGMSTRLLAGETYPALVETAGLEAFVTRIGESPLYRRLMERERATVDSAEILEVEAALLAAFAEDVGKVRHISGGHPRALVDLFLSRFDLHNVRTLVRGLLRARPPEEVRTGLVPLGSFSPAELEELAASSSLKELAGRLNTWGLDTGRLIAGVLKEADRQPGEPDLLAIDRALDEAWYPWAVEAARAIPGGEDLADSLAAEVDLRNIVTLLKLARRGTVAETRQAWLVRGGTLGVRQLAGLAAAGDVKGALEAVARTRYGQALGSELAGSERITEVERAVERLLARGFSKLFRKDPLGFATILGYLWRRYAEFTDLRLIARGLAFRLPAADVRAQMVHSL